MNIIKSTLLTFAWAATLHAAPPAATIGSAPTVFVRNPVVRSTVNDGVCKNFRTTGDALATNSLPPSSLAGLANLHASGSAQFSAAQLKQMLARFTGPVTVFDLRQEEHIFINGEPVNVHPAYWNKISADHDAIVSDEESQVRKLTLGMSLTVTDKQALKSGIADASTPIIVSQAATEREIVTAAGANYVRITVKDGGMPTDEEMDRFIISVRQLPPNIWVHFHCQAGHGRTTRFLAFYDMLHNANLVSLHDILLRQSLLVGEPDLLVSEKGGEKEESFASYLHRFYDYAQANPGGQPELWTQWLEKNNKKTEPKSGVTSPD
jgi:hypothetical protein